MAENRELVLVLRLVANEFPKELKNSQGALSSFNTLVAVAGDEHGASR